VIDGTGTADTRSERGGCALAVAVLPATATQEPVDCCSRLSDCDSSVQRVCCHWTQAESHMHAVTPRMLILSIQLRIPQCNVLSRLSSSASQPTTRVACCQRQAAAQAQERRQRSTTKTLPPQTATHRCSCDSVLTTRMERFAAGSGRCAPNDQWHSWQSQRARSLRIAGR
jgi:hypothetical protein